MAAEIVEVIGMVGLGVALELEWVWVRDPARGVEVLGVIEEANS